MPRIVVYFGSSPLPMTAEPISVNLRTPWGDASAAPRKYIVGDYEYLVLPRHGEQHEFAPHQINYRANIWLMHSLAVDGLLGTYTVGSVDPVLEVGQLVVPNQLIDYSWGARARLMTSFDTSNSQTPTTNHFDRRCCVQTKRWLMAAFTHVPKVPDLKLLQKLGVWHKMVQLWSA